MSKKLSKKVKKHFLVKKAKNIYKKFYKNREKCRKIDEIEKIENK